MATHSSVLAWRIPGTGSLVGFSLWGHRESDTTERLSHMDTCVASLVAQIVKNLPAMQETWRLIPGLGRSSGEGNGNPLQYPCLENPMDGGAWLATVHGVAKSRTRLSDFTSFTSIHTERETERERSRV